MRRGGTAGVALLLALAVALSLALIAFAASHLGTLPR